MKKGAIVLSPGVINWISGVNLTCWHLDPYHYALDPRKIRGTGSPLFPVRPKNESDKNGHGKTPAVLLGADKLMPFLLSVPENVSSFFICKRGSTADGCSSASVMDGHIIDGEMTATITGDKIAQMAEDSKRVREAMKAYRDRGLSVNGSFDEKKTKFTYMNCHVVGNSIVPSKLELTPDQFHRITLIYGFSSETGKIVSAAYVVAGIPSVVVTRGEGRILHKELPVLAPGEDKILPMAPGAMQHPSPRKEHSLR